MVRTCGVGNALHNIHEKNKSLKNKSMEKVDDICCDQLLRMFKLVLHFLKSKIIIKTF
jgi:hypothetical protein